MLCKGYNCYGFTPCQFQLWSYVVTIIIQITVFSVLLLLKHNHANYALNIALLGTYGACYSMTFYMHQLPSVTLAQMIPNSSQGYVQGIHQASYRIGAALGLFIPPLVYSWFTIDVIVITVMSTMLLLAVVARRKNIIEPQLLFSTKKCHLVTMWCKIVFLHLCVQRYP